MACQVDELDPTPTIRWLVMGLNAEVHQLLLVCFRPKLQYFRLKNNHILIKKSLIKHLSFITFNQNLRTIDLHQKKYTNLNFVVE